MRVAIIYRPKSPVPPEAAPFMIERMGSWVDKHAQSFSALEFFIGGGGMGLLDVDSNAELHRMVAENPFTPTPTSRSGRSSTPAPRLRTCAK